MVLKLALAIAAVAILTTLGIKAVYYPGRNTPNVQSKKSLVERGPLVEIARRKKADGQDKATISGLIIDYGGEGMELAEALKLYSVFIAEPTESKSFPLESSNIESSNISTWYKFRILETLAQNRYWTCSGCPQVAAVPQEMGQPNYDEFFVAISGGVVNIEGVEITQPNSSLHFETGTKYLMFVNLAPSQAAIVGGGPSGVFQLDKNDKLHSLNKQNAPLPAGIEKLFGSKLFEFRSHIKR